ncbi:MAG: monovalent cation/H+ antiporter complex subunit F [Geminicoccaceae bacterium]
MMEPPLNEVTEIAAKIALGLTVIGVMAGCIRLVLGPSLADRVVSLDLVTVLLVAIAALLALTTGVAAYLDLGLALALVGFLATVAFARYAERRPRRSDDRSEFEPKPAANSASELESKP